jgi:hypothetical protein
VKLAVKAAAGSAGEQAYGAPTCDPLEEVLTISPAAFTLTSLLSAPKTRRSYCTLQWSQCSEGSMMWQHLGQSVRSRLSLSKRTLGAWRKWSIGGDITHLLWTRTGVKGAGSKAKDAADDGQSSVIIADVADCCKYRLIGLHFRKFARLPAQIPASHTHTYPWICVSIDVAMHGWARDSVVRHTSACSAIVIFINSLKKKKKKIYY